MNHNGGRRSGAEDGGPRTSNAEPRTSNVPGLSSLVLGPSSLVLGSRPWSLVPSLSLCLWLLLVEVGVELWYRSHERHLRPAIAWRPEFPHDNASYQDQPLGEKARQLLRYDEGISGSWTEGSSRWQMIFLRWDPGRIAVHLARSHTPEICLTAAGRTIVSVSDLKHFKAGSLDLPFRVYTVEEAGHVFHVFYCLWEEGGNDPSIAATTLNYHSRIAPVLAGRRNLGQRSLEIAISGFDTAEAAEAAVQSQLQKLMKVEGAQRNGVSATQRSKISPHPSPLPEEREPTVAALVTFLALALLMLDDPGMAHPLLGERAGVRGNS